MVLYHGTSLERAENILRNGFYVKQNNALWLGQGIYFFLDEQKATWWAKDKCKYADPVYISCQIDNADSIKVLDLRKIEDWNTFYEYFQKYLQQMGEIEEGFVCDEALQCSLFDTICQENGYDAVIGVFAPKNQKYLNGKINFLEKVNLLYPEVQVCVREESLNILQQMTIHYI